MRVAVLGYGPAGLIAAKILLDEGHDVDVIGAGGKSVIGGAQYLHENVMNPRNTDPEDCIEFVKVGTKEGYRDKIYPDGTFDVSWDHYEGSQPAWALGPVYEQLWAFFQDKLIHDIFNGLSLSMLLETSKYDLVFSSIPAHALCLSPSSHSFPRVDIALVNYSPIADLPNVVMYSGRARDVWYRTSCIFGDPWTEFGSREVSKMGAATYVFDEEEDEPNQYQVHRGFKPLGTNCDCHPDMVRIGRFGLWDRKILLHHVPAQVRAALDERSNNAL